VRSVPRHIYDYLPGRGDETVNCFAYYRDKRGKPACDALTDIYCLKLKGKCAFFATPEAADLARRRTEIIRQIQKQKSAK
jgi:hypothetical protein